MARQKSPSLSLIFALALTGVGCGSDPEDLGTNVGPANNPVYDSGAPGSTAGATAGTVGGTTAGTVGGTTAGTLSGTTAGTAGGTIAGSAGGTTAGSAGGTTAGSAGGTTAGSAGGTTAGSAGGTTAGTIDAGLGSGDGGVSGSAEGGTAAPMGKGDCCPDGNCLCHGPVATKLSGSTKGSYKTATLPMSTGTLYYPTDATAAPFAGIAICPGFLNSGPEVGEWGSFYASWGIVTLVTDTFPSDFPDVRADLLLGSVEAMKKENSKSGSPLMGKMSDRYGTSGYSMGGGGTVIASAKTPSLKSSVGLAAWGPVNEAMVKVPTLLFCGTDDIVAPCSDHSDPAYTAIPSSTPKMKIIINGGDHLSAWFGPADGGAGVSGGWALAFEKVYLEGDTRWKALLLGKPAGATQTTNIMP